MPDRRIFYGVTFVLLIALIAGGTVAQYQGAFDDTVVVTVESDRAGLTLTGGAPVKLYGVEIGEVGEVRSTGDDVSIELRIDSDELSNVPADATAQIVPPTAFGAKYVQLTAPDLSSGRSMQAGGVIPATRVTVEVDEAFENLTKVLDVARPAEVDRALTAVAGAVDARGEMIGQLIEQTDAYLASFNPSLPTLSSDVSDLADVTDVYEAARPNLIAALDGAATTSTTLVQQQASLRALELSLTSFSDEADTLLQSSRQGLVMSMRVLEPVADVLERYSPELPCTVLGLVSANKLAEAAVGGTNPGVSTFTRVVPGRKPYDYRTNLPQLGENRGPVCFGLPYVTPREAEVPPPTLRTGANPYSGPQPTPEQRLGQTLTSLIIGGSNLP